MMRAGDRSRLAVVSERCGLFALPKLRMPVKESDELIRNCLVVGH